MSVRTIGGLLILLVALALQFFLASAGVYVNLAFAALITFAFLFDGWALALFVALAVFLVNWKPSVSREILVIALYPFATYWSRNLLTWRTWAKNFLAILIGFILLYFVATHGRIGPHFAGAFMDVAAAEIFSFILVMALYPSSRE